MTNSTNITGTDNTPERPSISQEGRENILGSNSNAYARIVNGTEEARVEMSDILCCSLAQAGDILRSKYQLSPEAQDHLVHRVANAQDGQWWAAEALKSHREFTLSQRNYLVEKIARTSNPILSCEVLDICYGLTEYQQEVLVQNLVRNNSIFSATHLLSSGKVFPEKLQNKLTKIINDNSAYEQATLVLTSGATLTSTNQTLLVESIPLAPESYIYAKQVLLKRAGLIEREIEVLIREIVAANKPEIARQILHAGYLMFNQSQVRCLTRVADAE